jgi:predicted phosphoribosyltransferase
MQAAAVALRAADPAAIVVAVPVGSRSACEALSDVADDVVCVALPEPFRAVGEAYLDFSPTTDEEVREALRLAAGPLAGAPDDLEPLGDATIRG